MVPCNLPDVAPAAPSATAPQAAGLARWRHALREPLNAILAAAEVMEAAPPGSDAATEARRIVARQARQLAWVISALPAGDGD